MSALTIRNAGPGDYARIVAIYNHYVIHSAATFDTRTFSVGERAPWFAGFADAGPHQMLVAARATEILGYAYSSRFNPRPAYDVSVETTVYLDPEQLGGGAGTALYEELFNRLFGIGLHGAYAGITLPNDASVRLHEKFGFRKIGVETEVGYKFDRFWDVARYERRLQA